MLTEITSVVVFLPLASLRTADVNDNGWLSRNSNEHGPCQFKCYPQTIVVYLHDEMKESLCAGSESHLIGSTAPSSFHHVFHL